MLSIVEYFGGPTHKSTKHHSVVQYVVLVTRNYEVLYYHIAPLGCIVCVSKCHYNVSCRSSEYELIRLALVHHNIYHIKMFVFRL